MKSMVSVPLTLPVLPCASLSNSLLDDPFQISPNFGCFRSSLYFNSLPYSISITANAAILGSSFASGDMAAKSAANMERGNFCWDSFLAWCLAGLREYAIASACSN